MTERIRPSALHGRVAAPASKSYLQRAIAIASLCEDECHIRGYTPSADVDAAISIARELGATVTLQGDGISISNGGIPKDSFTLHCGESGLSARMFSAIAALSPERVTIMGQGSLNERPFTMVDEALSQLGKAVELTNGRLPMSLSGTMRSGSITIDGSESSQLLTGLLIALPMLSGKSMIHVHHLRSVPYIQMTLDMLERFGIVIAHEDFKRFVIHGDQRPEPTEHAVEGDWSAAAFMLVGGAIAGEVTVEELNPHSAQADRAVIDALKDAGAGISWTEDAITVDTAPLQAFHFDATHCPDLFPPLAALAACCAGTSTITGIHRLRHKESDRATTISTTLQQLGIDVGLEADALHITGGKARAATVPSFNDHRIAMMAAILGHVADGEVIITGAEAVNKSYPAFFHDVASLSR